MRKPLRSRHQSLPTRVLVSCVAAVTFLSVDSAFAAEEFQPNPLELAPEGEVECSWSKLQRDEYQQCLAKKRFFENMTDKEKEAFNKEVEKRQTEERIKQLERNQVVHPPYKPK